MTNDEAMIQELRATAEFMAKRAEYWGKAIPCYEDLLRNDFVAASKWLNDAHEMIIVLMEIKKAAKFFCSRIAEHRHQIEWRTTDHVIRDRVASGLQNLERAIEGEK